MPTSSEAAQSQASRSQASRSQAAQAQSSQIKSSQAKSETASSVPYLKPGAAIGIVGGGQLGRMMALSAKYMGFRIGILDPTEDCPAAQVGDFQIVSDYDDREAIKRLAERCDVLTYEFENVDADALDNVADIVAIPQGTEILRATQDRIAEKTFINSCGVKTARWESVESFEELSEKIEKIGYPAVLKTSRGGYDGHGQQVLKTPEDLETVRTSDVWGNAGQSEKKFPVSILEGFVDFKFEASVTVFGDGEEYFAFPLVKNVHKNNILHTTSAPAEVSDEIARQAENLALKLAQGFKLAGTVTAELFVTSDGLVVNELAPRPHNSAHYTIEACDMDQFDAHIRSIAGRPLRRPKLLSPAVMINVLGQHCEAVCAQTPEHPEWNVHDYGKTDAKYNRKMGHITVLTENPARAVRDLELTGIWEEREDKAAN